MRARGSCGFSLVELLVATAVFLGVMALLFQFAARGQRLARSQPEAADLHQRLRVAVSMIKRDILHAGSGSIHGEDAGPLVGYLPPIVPARTGARAPDGEGTWFSDRISILYVPAEGWHVPLAFDMASASDPVPVDPITRGCPGAGLCGFVQGTRAVVLDRSTLGAGYDVFSVTGTVGGLQHGPPNPGFSRPYAAGTAIVMPVVHRVYYLDRANRRLMAYDGYQSDLPLVDNIVALEFSYFGDPRGESIARPADGEGSCVYSPGAPPDPLLASSSGRTLVPLAARELTDGPFCGLAPHRFDGDLLRIRRVAARIRVQASAGFVRGSGPAFAQPGSSPGGDSYVADFEVTFDVAPRNMEPRR